MAEASPGVLITAVENEKETNEESQSRRSKSPVVPIRTYLWEEQRRSRARGEYPWTHLIKPPFSEEEWLACQDHEYEPINPMPATRVAEGGGVGTPPRTPEKQREPRRFIRIPNTDQVIIPLHGSSDEEINPDRYQGGVGLVEDDAGEEEGVVGGGGGTPSTRTGSRAEELLSTSQVESSALERLPLQKSAREPVAPGRIGKKIQKQAGRIRSKFKSIPRPKINLPEKAKIKMPETPKFLTEKPKFLKEKPKFLTEKPKFLTEKPKFLTEKPKFLTEKPKFLTEKPKFLTEKPKFLTEKPKFLKERPKFKMPERPKFEAPKITMPKLDFMKRQPQQKPGTSSLRRPLREKSESVRSESGSKKNLFDSFKYPTYPRILKRKKKDRKARTPPPRMEVGSSLQSSPGSGRAYNAKWVETYRDIKFAEGEGPPGRKEAYDAGDEEEEEELRAAEDPAQFQDSYFPEAVRMERSGGMKAKAESTSSVMDSDKEQQSSGSSSARRRAGVLEEIDSDEFFLREKGLSREDVDVSRYLSLEIRDAFRSPKNALARLDSDLYFDDEDEPLPPPKAPQRRRAASRGRRSRSGGPRESDFHTFPLRPHRRKQSEPASIGSTRRAVEKPPRKHRSKSSSIQASMHSLPDRHLTDVSLERTSPPQAPRRRRSARDLAKREDLEWIDDSDAKAVDEVMAQDLEVQRCFESPPVAPVRRTRSRGTSLADEDRTSRGVESLPSEIPPDDLPMEDHVDDLDKEEAFADNLNKEDVRNERVTSIDVDIAGYAVVAKEHKEKVAPPRPPPPPSRHRKHQFRTLKAHGINFFFTYPRRAIKSFQRPPVRPVRNYSTLGPSRPPRRNRVFKEPVYIDEDAGEANLEHVKIQTLDEKPLPSSEKEEEDRDLQSGEVVEKMKTRPLPPPPRPPRKTKEEEVLAKKDKVEMDVEENVEQVVCALRVETEVHSNPPELPQISHQEAMKMKRDDFFSVFSQIKPPPDLDIEQVEEDAHEKRVDVQQQTSFDTESQFRPLTETVMEVTVSVQTDPLPDDYIVEETETISVVSESIATEGGAPAHSVTPDRSYRSEHLFADEPKPAFQDAYLSQEVKPSISHEVKTSEPIDRNFEQRQILVQQVIPEKLSLSELEVDRLQVNELQANKIVVSNIEGQTMQISELSSKSGNLVLGGLEMPPDVVQSIAAQIQTKLAEMTPQPLMRRVITPPPPIVISPTSSAVALSSPEVPLAEGPTDHIPKPKTTRSKGRKSPTRVIDDSEDELAATMPQRRHRDDEVVEGERKRAPPEEGSTKETRIETKEVEKVTTARRTSVTTSQTGTPTSGELLSQLFSIWKMSFMEGMDKFIVGVNTIFPEGEKRKDAQTAACIILVLIAGLLMLGFGSDNTVHHHHWDYIPPR